MLKSHRTSLMTERDCVPAVPRECCLEFYKMGSDVFEDKIVQRAELAIDDFRVRNDGLKVSDFSLENQIAAGVELKPAQLSLSTLPYADRLAYEASRLSEYVKVNTKND